MVFQKEKPLHETSDVGVNPRPEAMPAMNVTDGGPRGADSSKVLVVSRLDSGIVIGNETRFLRSGNKNWAATAPFLAHM